MRFSQNHLFRTCYKNTFLLDGFWSHFGTNFHKINCFFGYRFWHRFWDAFLVEKGSTSKKVTVGKDAIKTLPIRDVTELYNLQSGVVKIDSKAKGVPDRAEKGLEEVHVRGGRSGEIAYMIDGMYIRNPIYGGIGNGTRLNKFAIQEFDWQPGGFNAEYGDAMSAVSNLHTMTGGLTYSFKFNYETSLLGEALGSLYDELRDYNDYNFGIGGPLIPGWDKIKFWFYTFAN